MADSRWINEATLVDLRAKLAQESTAAFLKSIGISYGGTGLLLTLVLVFLAVPARVDEFLAESNLTETVQTVAEKALNGPEFAQLLRREIEDHLVRDRALRDLMIESARAYVGTPGSEGAQAIAGRVRELAAPSARRHMEGYLLRGPGAAAFERCVAEGATGFLASPKGAEAIRNRLSQNHSLIGDAVRTPVHAEIQRLVSAWSSRIEAARGALVRELDLASPEGLDKSSLEKLGEFMEQAGRGLATSGKSLALRVVVGRGFRYDGHVLKEYMRALGDHFEERFELVLVTDPSSKVLAALTPVEVKKLLEDSEGRAFAELLSTSPADSIRERLHRQVGPSALVPIKTSMTLQQALRDVPWRAPDRTHVVHVVVDDQWRCVGRTTRAELLNHILK